MIEELTKDPTPTTRADYCQKGLLIRGVEQRLLDLFSQGKLFGTVHTCIGQELSGIAVANTLRKGDLVFSNHRCHGHFLAQTDDVDGLVAEVMGKQSGICGGRGGSQHLCSQGFFSNGIQGGIVPVTAGLALSLRFRRKDNVAVAFIGDGTLGEGVLYEAMNIASKWDLPLVIVLENNLYAQSTPQGQTIAGDICARAAAFGIRTGHLDTWNVEALASGVAEAVSFVRQERRPFFLRIDTYRLMAHSKGDDNRDSAEVKSYWEKDPLQAFIRENPEEAAAIQATVTARIDTAVAKAEAAPYAAASTEDEDAAGFRPGAWVRTRFESEERVVSLLHASFQRNMKRDERIVMIGEDIEGPYGGAFKVTKNLSQEFPGRVRNTPISEAAIMGLGNGLALSGMLPVVEIMFGDFLTLGADQWINHASKFRYMYNNQVDIPLIVRTPMGGKRGYGPTHSQSLEKHFLGVPGTRVLALHSRYDPSLIYDALFAHVDRPTLVVENKLLYGHHLSNVLPDGFVLEHTDEPFPTTRLRPGAKADLTILCYGGMLLEAEAATVQLFEEDEIVCEIISPTQLYPFNAWPLFESVRQTGRLLIVEEGLGFASFGAEAAAQVAEGVPGALRRVKRLASPRHPIPSSGPLEKALLPGIKHIIEAAQEVIHD